MPDFELSYLGDCDIAGIIGYTIEKWDIDQAIRDVGILDTHFEAIGKGDARTKAFFGHRTDLRVSRCKKHVICHQERAGNCPLILAIFHECMELMVRLSVPHSGRALRTVGRNLTGIGLKPSTTLAA